MLDHLRHTSNADEQGATVNLTAVNKPNQAALTTTVDEPKTKPPATFSDYIYLTYCHLEPALFVSKRGE